MTNKYVSELEDFDFGFSIVNEEELDVVQSIKREIATSFSTLEEWKAQTEEWNEKANAIYKSVLPLLNNLCAEKDKDYIYWPDRHEKIEQFKLRLNKILNS